MMSLKIWGIGLLLIFTIGGCTTTNSTTDGTTNFLSSTSGKTWWTPDGLVKQGEHAGAFVSVNYDNLLQDIARGDGEYLLAFGKILNVSSNQQQSFSSQLQLNYDMLSNIPNQPHDIQVTTFIEQVESVTGHHS